MIEVDDKKGESVMKKWIDENIFLVDEVLLFLLPISPSFRF